MSQTEEIHQKLLTIIVNRIWKRINHQDFMILVKMYWIIEIFIKKIVITIG